MHEVVPMAVRNAVSAATRTFTASSMMRCFFMVRFFSLVDVFGGTGVRGTASMRLKARDYFCGGKSRVRLLWRKICPWTILVPPYPRSPAPPINYPLPPSPELSAVGASTYVSGVFFWNRFCLPATVRTSLSTRYPNSKMH